MKYIIGYLLIGVLVQIIVRIVFIAAKQDLWVTAKMMDHALDENTTLDNHDYKNIVDHPVSILINVLLWPINVGIAVITIILLMHKIRGGH